MRTHFILQPACHTAFSQDHACNAAVQLCVANGLINASEKVTTPGPPFYALPHQTLTRNPIVKKNSHARASQIFDFFKYIAVKCFVGRYYPPLYEF